MTDTIAKPIVNGKFWVLQQNNQKIGSVEKTPTGYFLKTNKEASRFKTINSLRDITKIKFDSILERVQHPENQVNRFPTDCKPYNGVWDINQRLPIYTKKRNLKAGMLQDITWLQSITKPR